MDVMRIPSKQPDLIQQISKLLESFQYLCPPAPAANSSKYNKTLINAVDKAGARIIGVGIHGIIIYSDDLGNTWEQASVPTTKTLTDIDCVDETTCWVTGHDAYILKTVDRGQNWSVQYEDEIFDLSLIHI